MIWNYLDQPTSLPRAAFGYWWPLASLRREGGWCVLAGLFSGLAHLARADRLLVLFVAAGYLGWSRRAAGSKGRTVQALAGLGRGSPWWSCPGRGTSGVRTLWLRTYDELFAYSQQPTLGHFLG